MSGTLTSDTDTCKPSVVRLKDYKVPSYFIDEVNLEFDLHDEYTTVKSLMHVRANRHTEEIDKQLRLNGEELMLLSVKIDGVIVPETSYTQTKQFLLIDNVPDTFDLEIVARIQPEKNTALSGLYRSGLTYCTQCEPEGFRRITYFLDHPDILARYTTTIIADQKKYPVLLSNGNLIATDKVGDGRHFATWQDPFKKPCYLFAMVAGSFDLIEDHFITSSNRDVTLRIYTDKGYGDAADHAMFSLKEAMRWDEKAYGREYDLDIYMIVAIGDFNMGAMENKGLNIFNTKYVLAKPSTATDDDYIHILSVIGHEYFHNWSGNRVTCRDWFQLSLKEGLTIFRDQTFTEDLISKAVMRIRDVNRLREVQFSEDAGPLSHPVRPDSYIEINNFYTSTIYEKGSEVLRMLQTILGASLFRKGMDLYFAKFDGQAVTIDDFVSSMEDISGIDLKQFRLWYSQAGTPLLDFTQKYDASKKTFTLEITQKTLPTPGQKNKLPLYIPIRLGLLDKSGKALPLKLAGEEEVFEKVIFMSQEKQSFIFKEVESAPIPSLLRHFSAPVKMSFPYTDEELIFLSEHDKDDYNRWEALQKYMLRIILRMVEASQKNEKSVFPEALADCFKFILTQDSQDKLLLSEMLAFPSEKYIGEQMSIVDVDHIHAVRKYLMLEMAKRLDNHFLEIYHQLHKSSYDAPFNLQEVGGRQLKNRCLSYFMLLDKNRELGIAQFNASLSRNMTDAEAVLSSLTNIAGNERDESLSKFYQAFQSDPLVIDKWLAIQARSTLPNALELIKGLFHHPAFDIKNPNKVYALIGTFGGNRVAFHAKDGKGYVFLREVVAELDRLNPQVAGRMVNPLTSFKRYDKERQQIMRAQLELLIGNNKLSPDLYELVTKSLE